MTTRILIGMTLIGILSIQASSFANSIADVNKTDGAYPSIKRSVESGLLPLFNNQAFKPNHKITRKELAIALDNILKQVESQSLWLSKTEMKELKHLSKSFKKSHIKLEKNLNQLEKKETQLSEEQRVLHHNISQLQDQLNTSTSESRKQRMLMWIGIGVAGFLGLLSG